MLFNMPKGDVILREWNILQVHLPHGGLSEHFIGYSEKDGLGRLSTRIEFYDEQSKNGATESGSTYSTIGKPGRPHDDALYVLEGRIGKSNVERELFSNDASGKLNFKYPII